MAARCRAPCATWVIQALFEGCRPSKLLVLLESRENATRGTIVHVSPPAASSEIPSYVRRAARLLPRGSKATNLRFNLWLLLAALRSGFFQVPSLAHQREMVQGSACGFHLLSFHKAGSQSHGGSPEHQLHQLQRRKHSDVIFWSSEEKDCNRFCFIGRTHAQHWLKSDANAFFLETFFMSPCFVLADCRSDSV